MVHGVENKIMKKGVKIGDRVELLFMNDTWTQLEKGDKGTVFKIEKQDGDMLIWVNWDNGERLALLDEIDRYRIVKE